MNQKQLRGLTVALMLGNVMAGLDSTIINTAIPAIIADLHGIQFMGWIVAIFLLGLAVAVPIWTKIGQKISNKAALIVSLFLFIIGSTLQGLAPNMIFFLAARFVMGLGAGGMGSLPYIIAGMVYKDLSQRTRLLTLLTVSWNLAAISGPLLGGIIIDSLSWHWVFYLNVPIGILALALIFAYYKHSYSQKTAIFDLWGACWLSVCLITFLFGIQLLGLALIWVPLLLIILAVLAFLVFWHVEKDGANPVVPVELFQNRALCGDFLLFALAWGSYIAVNTYLPMWAQALLGTTALVGGITLIPNSLISIVGSSQAGRGQREWTFFKVMLISLLCMLVSSTLLLFAGMKTSVWLLALFGSFAGFGVGLCFVSLQVKVQVDAGKQMMATATSTSYLVRMLAQTTMSAIYGVIMNWAMARGLAGQHKITLEMMNKLSQAKTAASLPQSLLPQMRTIFHNGLHEVMAVSMALGLLALLLNFYYNGKKPQVKKA